LYTNSLKRKEKKLINTLLLYFFFKKTLAKQKTVRPIINPQERIRNIHPDNFI